MEACDLLVCPQWLLPIAPDNIALEKHALAIKDGQIVALGDRDQLLETWQPAETLELADHIVLPGLINAHGHLAMTLLRGAGEDESLQDWLHNTIWPLEAQYVSADFVSLGTELAIAEMTKSGTTTFADMYYFPEQVAELANRYQIRAQVAFPVIEGNNVWSESSEQGIHKGLALFDEYRHHPLVNIMFGPHAAYTVNPETLSKVGIYANELEAGVQIHMHENRAEVDAAKSQIGKTWIQLLAEQGLLGPHVQAVHMTAVDDQDLATIAETATRVVHCPNSNLKLASGYCDIERLRKAGVTFGIGTDGAASNNSLNMFTELRMAALLAKHHHRDPTAGQAKSIIASATLGGAEALGISETTGSLEVGKAADFIAVDCRATSLQPMYDPYAALAHSDAGNHVSHVFVAGVATLDAGELTKIDEGTLLGRVAEWSAAR